MELLPCPFCGGIFIGKIPDNVVLSDEDADAAIDKAMEGK